MGGHSYHVYIGRDVTSEEEHDIKMRYENDEHLELDHEKSSYKIDGFNVAYEDVFDQYVVCQHYIGELSHEEFDNNLHEGIDYTVLPKPHDKRYKLRIRYGGS